MIGTQFNAERSSRRFRRTSKGCLSTTVNVLCSSHCNFPAGVSTGNKSNLQTRRAKINRISAHASSLPMQDRGPTPNGWIALVWSISNSGLLSANQRSGRNASGLYQNFGDRDTVNECTLTNTPSGSRSPETTPPPDGVMRGAPTGLLQSAH
jgi:hypothetical protein